MRRSLYLRHLRRKGEDHYILRESVWKDGCWGYRDLLDMGVDPNEFIEYPGGNGFYFKPELEEALEELGVQWTSEDLEAVFMPFLPPHIQRIIEVFRGPAEPSRWHGLSDEEMMRRQSQLHPFDKRRLHYLRCGRIDIGNLQWRPFKFLNILLDKGRDEIEHLLEEMEARLKPHEIRPYLFTAFHLQSYFPHSVCKNQPAALDPEKVDEYFLEEICSLNRDPRFFRGIPDHDPTVLDPLLVKYVIHYFDCGGQAPPFDHDFLRFFGAGRSARPGRTSSSPTISEACRTLGFSTDRFDAMKPRELIRIYRAKAMAAHPDHGGDHDAFIRLTEAYECLLMCKGKRGAGANR